MKRLRKEINELKKIYICDFQEDKNELNIKLNDSLVTMNFTFSYPFVPPKVLVDGNNWCTFCRSNDRELQEKLKKVFGTECLCCHNLLTRWCPSDNIISLLNEVKKIQREKDTILYSLIKQYSYFTPKIQAKIINYLYQ